MRLRIEIRSNMTYIRAKYLKSIAPFVCEMTMADKTHYEGVIVKDVVEDTRIAYLMDIHTREKFQVSIHDIVDVTIY